MPDTVYTQLLRALDAHSPAALLTWIRPGEKGGLDKAVLRADAEGRLYPDVHGPEILDAAGRALNSGLPARIPLDGAELLIEPFYPEARLIVLGAGHIAVPLSDFASKSGFSVTVFDDRPSFADPGRFPGAHSVICDRFETCAERLNVHPGDFAVIVTRGHRHDAVCLRQFLGRQTAYLGMIGSKRRVRAMKEQMLQEGFSQEALDRLHSPIGLPIGAVTPGEIAVSILSEVIQEKREAPESRARSNECDLFVLEALAAGTEGAAVATVTAARGSVPRGAGAKMVVWPDGKLLGSIGGGCSEAEVINAARRLLDGGGHRLMTVGLTGDAEEEEEGMACGGIMEVFIETC